MRNYVSCNLILKIIVGAITGALVALVASIILSIALPTIVLVLPNLFIGRSWDRLGEEFDEVRKLIMYFFALFGVPYGTLYGAVTFPFYTIQDKTPFLSKVIVSTTIGVIATFSFAYWEFFTYTWRFRDYSQFEFFLPSLFYGLLTGVIYSLLVGVLFEMREKDSFIRRGSISGVIFGVITYVTTSLVAGPEMFGFFGIIGTTVGGLIFGMIGFKLTKVIEQTCAWVQSQKMIFDRKAK
ncbi:MAG: hypothetical protein GY797_15485 [Deltaproteobacteria bacterium]|nr:hypothetical protein [Deltaproteobacteria bacterium]